jgi:hypothetical protein
MGSKKNITSAASKSSKSAQNNVGRKNHGSASKVRGTSSDEMINQSEYLSFTKDQLKTELKRRGLKTSGSKTELV